MGVRMVKLQKKQNTGRVAMGPDQLVFNIMAYIFLVIVALLAFIPFFYACSELLCIRKVNYNNGLQYLAQGIFRSCL